MWRKNSWLKKTENEKLGEVMKLATSLGEKLNSSSDKVVKVQGLLFAGFTWKWWDCLADCSVRSLFSKPLTQCTCSVVHIL